MKKMLSLVLAVVMVMGLSTAVFAQDTKINGMNTGLQQAYDANNNTSSTDLSVRAGDTIEVPLTGSVFTYDGEELAADAAITSALIRSGKVTVRTSVRSGSKVIEKISLNYKKFGAEIAGGEKTAYIKIEFVDQFVSTKDIDFDASVYLVINGTRQDDYALDLAGTIKNNVTEVYEGDDYVDLSDGQVVEAMDYVKKIEADLGNNVSVHTKMFKGKKYYGSASLTPDSNDLKIMADNADIELAYTLKTVGINSTADKVEFDLDDTFYVYSLDKEGNLVYVGKSNELLPLASKYYLAGKELVLADDEEDIDEEDVIDSEDNPSTGGDDSKEVVNYNPSTGR